MRWKAVLLAGILTSCLASATQAQVNERDRRKEFVEGLLESLIDSQSNRRPPPQQPGPPPQGGVQVPVQAPPGTQPPFRPQPLPQEFQETRQTLSQIAAESSRLIAALQADADRAPSVPDHLREAIKLNAAATTAARRSTQTQDSAGLMDDVRGVDRHWRVLAHRLRREPRLGPQVRTAASQLDSLTGRLCELCHIEPQLDYTELSRLSDSLASTLRYLAEDVAIELPRGPEQTQLTVQAGKTQRLAQEFAASVNVQRPHAELVEQFKLVADPWSRLASRLRPIENRIVQRSVSRVDEIHRAVFEQLWMAPPIDQAQLLQLSGALMRDVQRLFDSVTLGTLIELRGASSLLGAGGEFYGLCQNFERVVRDGDGQAELADAFQLIANSWPGLRGPLGQVQSPAVTQALEQTERSLIALRETLQLRPAFDRQAVTQISASLHALAEQLRGDMRRQVIANPAYDPQLRTASDRHSAEFSEIAEHLHEASAEGGDEDHLAEHAQEVAAAWKAFQSESLDRLRSGDRVRYSAIVSKVTPLVVDLQAVFAR